ncbi:hypothetical protein [Methylorubrum suomiense]|uniref:hypothetical protein n=1 Tax=Methylorubrum suomiense TaxID=144191 RepID=UPI0010F88286|nr:MULTISPECIES: hypothetical protein [Methylobacteriaceae]
MIQPVLYQILDRPDGRFDVTATLASNRTYTRESLASFAEVDASLNMLRAIMAACGAEVLLDPVTARITTRVDA